VVSNRLDIQKNLTTREILTALDSNLSRNIKTLLHEMYNLYEAARFGGYELNEIEINQFNKKLELLNKIITHEYSRR
jgi:phosphoglucomutase